MDYRRSVKKNQASKYDFVKVKVYLSSQHYYVLSRFLLCRMLTAARIEYGHALRIALDLKKKLVDKPQLDVSQADLQVELFELIRQHGYSQQHVEWYKITAKSVFNIIIAGYHTNKMT
jgi:2-phosphoglycerate kinase